MAISFVAAGTAFAPTTAATSYTLNLPAGVVEGDVMLGFAMTGVHGTFSPPTGWAEVGTFSANDATVDAPLYVCKRTFQTGDTSPTDGVCPSSSRRIAGVLAYRGTAPAVEQFLEHGGNSSITDSATITTPTVNNPDSEAWAVAGYSAVNQTASGSFTHSVLSERFDTTHTTSSFTTLTMADTNGTIGTGNVSYSTTYSQTALCQASWVGILRPARPNPMGRMGVA